MAERAVSLISESLSLEQLREHPMVKPFRIFYWKLGIDPTKMRPSHEALARRILRSKKMPSVNPIVDIGNIISIKHLVPIGVYDVDKIKPPLVFTLLEKEELFIPIGSRRPWRLRPHTPVLRDAEDIIHVYPSRDSARTAINDNTRNILIIAGGVDGIPYAAVQAAIKELIALYTGLCGGKTVGGERVFEYP